MVKIVMVVTFRKEFSVGLLLLTTFQIFDDYRHSSIYAVNVGTHKKPAESENRVNRAYLVALKGRKIG